MDDALLGASLTLIGVGVGFALQQADAWRRDRAAGRRSLRALWLEISEVDFFLRTHLTTNTLPDPEVIVLKFPTLEGRASDLVDALSFEGLNFVARALGSSDLRIGHMLRLLAEADYSDKPVSQQTRDALQQNASDFHAELILVGKYIDALVRLTPSYWLRHPSRAWAARQRIKTRDDLEREREERFREESSEANP